jgi:hypothetical protein
MGQHERVDIHSAKPTGVDCARQAGEPKPGTVSGMPKMVTGDAVVLDVQIAQLPVRAVGALIDISLIFVGYVLSLVLW